MNSDNATSGTSTATTSASAPGRENSESAKKQQKAQEKVAPSPGTPAKTLSESEYLAQQANNAKLALVQALSDFGSKLGQGADPRLMVHQAPWLTLGAAAVA